MWNFHELENSSPKRTASFESSFWCGKFTKKIYFSRFCIDLIFSLLFGHNRSTLGHFWFTHTSLFATLLPPIVWFSSIFPHSSPRIFFRSTRAKTFSPFARKTENEKPFFQSTQRKRRIFRERDFPHQHKRIGDVEREIHWVEFHRLAMVCNRDSAQFSSLSAYFDNSRITPQVFPRWKSCSGLEKLQSSLFHPHINLPEAIEKELSRCVVTQS